MKVIGTVYGSFDMSASIAMLVELGFKITKARALTRSFSGEVDDLISEELIKKGNELPFVTVIKEQLITT